MQLKTRNSDMRVIGLHGLPGVGKDMVADYLVRAHGFTKFAFADKLRIEVCEAFGVHINMLTNRALKTTPDSRLSLVRCTDDSFVGYLSKSVDRLVAADRHIARSPRWIMQRWGDYRLLSNSRYFILPVITAIGKLQDHRGAVISDVRTFNEAVAIRSILKAEIVEVVRRDNEILRQEVIGDLNHRSNVLLNRALISEVLMNNSTPEDAFSAMDQYLSIDKP